MVLRRILALTLCVLMLTGCACAQSDEAPARLKVIATLFPQYDFVKQICGDGADVTLLLPPGTESHSFEPTPKDMASIQEADVFIYTGADMEPWAETILSAIDAENLVVVNASEGVELMKTEHDHDDHDGHEDHDDHDHEYDPHIWLDPVLAIDMVNNIRDGLIEADPAHEADYMSGAEAYVLELQALDGALAEMVNASARNFLVFGGRFSYGYLMKRYGLEYDCAYDSCSAASEPSVKVMAELIGEIAARKLPAVYHEEMASTTVTDALCEQTGAKSLLLHSCHNVSQDELEAGVTYLDLMYANLESLREGLN